MDNAQWPVVNHSVLCVSFTAWIKIEIPVLHMLCQLMFFVCNVFSFVLLWSYLETIFWYNFICVCIAYLLLHNATVVSTVGSQKTQASGLSVCSFHPVSLWLLYTFTSFKLWMCECIWLFVSMQPCDELETFPGCHPAFALWQLWQTPADPRHNELKMQQVLKMEKFVKEWEQNGWKILLWMRM